MLFDGKAQQPAAAARSHDVVDVLALSPGQANGEEDGQVTGLGYQPRQSALARSQERPIMEQVARGVTGKVQLGQRQRAHARRRSLAYSVKSRLRVAFDIGHANLGRRRGYAKEPVTIAGARGPAHACKDQLVHDGSHLDNQLHSLYARGAGGMKCILHRLSLCVASFCCLGAGRSDFVQAVTKYMDDFSGLPHCPHTAPDS